MCRPIALVVASLSTCGKPCHGTPYFALGNALIGITTAEELLQLLLQDDFALILAHKVAPQLMRIALLGEELCNGCL